MCLLLHSHEISLGKTQAELLWLKWMENPTGNLNGLGFFPFWWPQYSKKWILKTTVNDQEYFEHYIVVSS